MALTTVTLKSIWDFCSTHLDLLQVVGNGGYVNEPALSISNDAIGSLLMAPNDWDCNRIEMPFFVTAPNRQDYVYAGAVAFTLGSTSSGCGIGLAASSAITESGTTVTVRFLETCRFAVGDTFYMAGNTVSGYNSTFIDDGITSTWSNGWTILTIAADKLSLTFTHTSSGLATSGAPGINDYGWLTDATMTDLNDTACPRRVRKLQAEQKIQPTSDISDPIKVSVLKDNGNGTIKLRLREVPGTTTWAIYPNYQAKFTMKQAPTDTIAPFTDSYASLVRQAILYRMYRYVNSSRAEIEFAKLQQEVDRAMGADNRTQSDMYLVPEDGSLMDWSY